jgi:hypothetical protein
VGVKQWIQGMLPVFEEPILPGDFVKVARFIPTSELDAAHTDAQSHVGEIGQVVALDPVEGSHETPYLVSFNNGDEYYYRPNELERQA